MGVRIALYIQEECVMFKKLLIAASAATLIVATPTFAQVAKTQISGGGFARLRTLDLDCRGQMKQQRPSLLKAIFLPTLRSVPFSALGTALGANAAGFTNKITSLKDYAVYAGGSTAGGMVGGALNSYEVGKSNAQAGCMSFFVGRNRRERDEFDNVGIIYNSYMVRGKAIRGPDGKKVGKGDYFVAIYTPEKPVGDARTDASNTDDTSSPPPRGN